MNIRTVGSYEITIFDPSDKRIEEIVIEDSLYAAQQLAKSKLKKYGLSHSYTISKIVNNSKYNKWVPNKELSNERCN